ncbi:integrase catalytic domain-containing protein [Trichonephila clavipes]|nr:integrase catalytic domain-containing protein [Trichonephila clavipes]
MKEGAFELRCWASNDSKEDQDMQMVLGLSWNVVNDELSCKLPSNLDCTQESASHHLIDDHQGTDIAAQIPGPNAADVLD